MNRVMLAVALAVGIVIHQGVFAQEPTTVAPDMYKEKLKENGARILEVTFKPGQKIAEHSHPDHLVYALTDGKISITEKGKEAQVIDVKTGDTMYLKAQTHSAQNVGDTTLRLVVVELPPKE